MAEIFNEQRVLGIVLQDEGAVMFNNQPVIGIADAGGELFVDNERTRGVVEVEDLTIYNDQPVLGAVLIEDGRKIYNNQTVIPVKLPDEEDEE